ncbi:type I 3-dehydroquinate dehydratase [Amnibacterium kyonggiense]|uniref:3-dehydroquinate dehydratase n=1 Tax=Amnibacterium kyonggiense TaxID=595671 RepID=A0A4R7FR10_9MICO|nr:type I 3-dehydroquinate dehydratase [Amnibacterium kyonggiense]TDS80156.1 3-dehydroquinate dehydratase [Amnibacterium kyonggiense]
MTVRVGSVELGTGRPKVCVPLTSASLRELQAEAAAVTPAAADLVELRIDRLDGATDQRAVREAIDLVGVALDPSLPVLLTFRTAAEGGGAAIPAEAYRDLLIRSSASDVVDAVDVEAALPREVVDAIMEGVHAEGKPVVLSFHDLQGTPSRQEIVGRLVGQQALGADVVKLACTPQTPEDVLTLLAATADYTARPDARPAITMAMGGLGVVSRLAGETFGSCVTFGTVGAASAPGQVDALRLRDALDLLHTAVRAS